MSAKIEQLFSVAGQTVVITGGASGIGFAIAEAMAENGARIALLDLDADGMQQAATKLQQHGAEIITRQTDVADHDAVVEAMAEIAEAFGSIDIVFANAGISGGPGFMDLDGSRPDALTFENAGPERLKKTLLVNIGSIFYTIQAATPHMKAAGKGRIILTSSVSAFKPELTVGAGYIASKTGVAALVRQAALELAKYNINVNAIAPAPTTTNIADGRLHDPAMKEFVGRIAPLGRIATPEDMQGAALFLASKASDYMTGATILVDGGILLGPDTRPEA